MRQNLILAASTLVPLLLVSLGAGPSPATESPSAPPDSPSKPVTDRYFDVEVTDGFRWLEDWTDPAVRTWSEAPERASPGSSSTGFPGSRPSAIGSARSPGFRPPGIPPSSGAGRPSLRSRTSRPVSRASSSPSPRPTTRPASARSSIPTRSIPEGRHRHRLVRPVLRRTARRRFALGGRKRGRKPSVSTRRRRAARSPTRSRA